MAITKVTNSLVAVNAIQGTLIADNAITSVHIAQNQVTAVQIPDGSITSTQIAANSIDTAELVTGSIDTIHIGNDQVTTAKIADLNVTTGKIANNAITSAKIPDGSITATQLDSSTAPTFGNITTTGSLRGPASFTIDPAAVGDNTGTVVIAGSLQVDGTTTTVNSTTLSVADKNIVIASGAADAAAANEAGLTVTGASATLLYKSSGDKWEFNKDIQTSGNLKVSSYETELHAGHLRFKFNGGAYIDNNTTGQSLNFRVSNSSSIDTTAMTINSNGRVGIGAPAPTPTNTLHVHSATSSDIAAFENNNGKIVIGKTANLGSIDMASDAALRIRHGSTLSGYFDSSGNVGIKTTPNYPLDVNGKIYSSSEVQGGTAVIKDAGSLGAVLGSNSSSRGISLARDADPSSYPDLVITAEGKIGIGEDTPVSELHISGNISIHNSSNAPYIDFVENGATGDSKARITMDQVDGSNGQLFFYTEGSGTLTKRMTIMTNGGVEIGDGTNYGYVKVINDSAVVQYLDRRGTDGAVLEIRHADATDGQINTLSGRMAIGSGDTGIFFDSTRDAITPFDMGQNDGRGNAIDLGRTAIQFKDLHMSGTAHISGAIENVGASNRINHRVFTKVLTCTFSHGTANQKAKIILGTTFWGDLEVSATGSYSNQDMSGTLTKRYACGLNPSNSVYTNEAEITNEQGDVSTNFHLGDIEYDSSLGKYVIVCSHRNSNGNELVVYLRFFGASTTHITAVKDVAFGSVYTSDTSTKKRQSRTCAFLARLTSSQTLPSSSGTRVVFNVADINESESYDTSTGVFTVPQSGIYTFGFNSLVYPHTSGILNMLWLKNNSTTLGHTVQQGAAAASHTAVNSTVMGNLTAGDTVDVRLYGSSVNSGVSIYGGQTYWFGHMI